MRWPAAATAGGAVSIRATPCATVRPGRLLGIDAGAGDGEAAMQARRGPVERRPALKLTFDAADDHPSCRSRGAWAAARPARRLRSIAASGSRRRPPRRRRPGPGAPTVAPYFTALVPSSCKVSARELAAPGRSMDGRPGRFHLVGLREGFTEASRSGEGRLLLQLVPTAACGLDDKAAIRPSIAATSSGIVEARPQAQHRLDDGEPDSWRDGRASCTSMPCRCSDSLRPVM